MSPRPVFSVTRPYRNSETSTVSRSVRRHRGSRPADHHSVDDHARKSSNEEPPENGDRESSWARRDSSEGNDGPAPRGPQERVPDETATRYDLVIRSHDTVHQIPPDGLMGQPTQQDGHRERDEQNASPPWERPYSPESARGRPFHEVRHEARAAYSLWSAGLWLGHSLRCEASGEG